jgi:MFS family permease
VPAVLKASRLRRILAAYTVNRLGTWFGLIALSLAVFDHTHSALAVAGLLVAGQVLPAFVVPALVARVEASRRGRELSGLYTFEAVVTVALAVLLWHFSLPAVLLLVALDGTAALAASALLRTETARAARDELAGEDPADGDGPAEERAQDAERRANAALNVAFSVTFVLGPALAGAIVAAGGAPLALFVDAASFLICGAVLLDLHPHVENAAGESVRSRLRAAWRHINEVPALRALLITQAVAMVFFESAAPIEVAYAKVTLAAGDSGFGFLVGTWGAGVVLGSIVFARSSSRPLGVMLTAGTLAVGAGYVGFAAAPSLLAACPAALVGGIGNGIQWAPMISAVQRLTPQALLGRVMSAVESMGALCPAVGLLLGGVLVALSSPRVAFTVVGVGAMLTTLAFMRIHVDQAATATGAGKDVGQAEAVADPELPARTGTIEPAPH